jgi:hypothetical protein
MDFRTHRICMIHLGVPSFFVLLSQTGARCLLHSSDTSVYHEIFLVFFFKGVLDMICQTVKTLKPWCPQEQSVGVSELGRNHHHHPKKLWTLIPNLREPKTFKLFHIVEDWMSVGRLNTNAGYASKTNKKK